MNGTRHDYRTMQTSFEGVPLYLHMLVGEEVVIFDSGCAYMTESEIRPFVERAGSSLEHISTVLITHEHFDHVGGNYAVKHRSGAAIAASAQIETLLQDHEVAFHDYHLFPEIMEYSEEYRRQIFAWMGPAAGVDRPLQGGDRVACADREIRVITAPGHAKGGLMYFDESQAALIPGDALQGSGLVAGAIRLCPEYRDLPGYLETLRRAEELDPAVLLPSHFPEMRGKAVDEFFRACRRAVSRLENAVIQAAEETGRAGGPVPLVELAWRTGRILGYEYGLELLTGTYTHANDLGIELTPQ